MYERVCNTRFAPVSIGSYALAAGNGYAVRPHPEGVTKTRRPPILQTGGRHVFQASTTSAYCPETRNTFGSAEGDCAVKLPNNSPPLLMSPSPSPSSASYESSDPAAVHESLSAEPSLLMSKVTPPSAPVMRKPSPAKSASTGEG